MKRRSPLDPESSRTQIVAFLTFSPELTLGSGFFGMIWACFFAFNSLTAKSVLVGEKLVVTYSISM